MTFSTHWNQLTAECEAAWMRNNTAKSEAMTLSRKPVVCLLRVGNESVAQVKKFNYLGVLFASEGTMAREIGWRIGAAGAQSRSIYRSIVTKSELSHKTKLSIYRLIFVPTLT